MSESESTLDSLVESLKRQRDELKVQVHLAGMEAQDEYSRLSDKCDQLADQYEPIRGAVEDSAKDVATALGMVADELLIGLKRVGKAIEEQK